MSQVSLLRILRTVSNLFGVDSNERIPASEEREENRSGLGEESGFKGRRKNVR